MEIVIEMLDNTGSLFFSLNIRNYLIASVAFLFTQWIS